MLDEYTNKRHFGLTPEPQPQTRPTTGPLIFVVQKHSAHRLHFDFRIEVDGVLKSWAVPNGPSLDPKVKRLAVMVEDHPIEYKSFEGVIPKGEYGAGQVIVWDQGTYSPDEDGKLFFDDRNQAEKIIQQGLQKGKISLLLRGSKLRGSWALVKLQHTQNDWLLIKHQDEYAKNNFDIQGENASVISGLTIEDFKGGQASDRSVSTELASITGVQPSSFPSSIRPMLASLTKKPFSNSNWIFEPKLDGYRTIAFIHNGEIRLASRNGLGVSDKYPDLVKELSQQTAKEIVLDGEIIALDENGRSCFQCLQNHWNHNIESNYSIVYYVFDILYLNGYDLRTVSLLQRKRLLSSVFSNSGNIRLTEYFETDGLSLYEASIKLGLEGIIAKLKNSLYESGHRSQNWLKIKQIQSDEFIISGYTQGTGNRSNSFGALLLGSYDAKGQLIFVGHVGSGFDDKTLAELLRQMDVLKTEKSPFFVNPPSKGPVTWVKPELVAEVKFTERTQEGYLRAPVFLRLREDKSPSEVHTIDFLPEATSDDIKEKDSSIPKYQYLEHIVKQLGNQDDNFNIEVDGFKIFLTNLDKEIWPDDGDKKAITKRELLIYLTKVSPYLLPHLKDRPLTLTRFPNGIYGEHFYQKHWNGQIPGFIQIVALSESDSGIQDYIICNNLQTLLWLGQLANIDLHTWFSRVTPERITLSPGKSNDKTPDYFSYYPDFIIFDIDPYIYSGNEPEGAEPELNHHAFEKAGKVALWLKDILDNLSLNSFVKTSGRTGLHVYVPIIRQFDFHEVHSAAKTIASFIFQKYPQDITIDWSVASRTGKIFLDYNQNVRGKTLASIYSPRPTPQATVSTPLFWEEISKVYPTDFTILNIPDRLAKVDDIWAGMLQKRSDLGKMLGLSK